MVIWRGKELVMLYNNAWRPLQGTKYPKALQQVRTLEQVRQIPAIALTAYAGEVNRQQAIQAGFQTPLSKQIEPLELIKAISALINSKEQSKRLNALIRTLFISHSNPNRDPRTD